LIIYVENKTDYNENNRNILNFILHIPIFVRDN